MEKEVAVLFILIIAGLSYQYHKLKEMEKRINKLLEEVDLQNHPSFFVTLEKHPYTLTGIDDVLKFDKVMVNIGSGYDLHSGHFVCPKSGVYHFSAMILSVHDHHYQLNKNDNPYVLGFSHPPSADSSTVSVIVQLVKGDRVYIKHRHSAAEQVFGLNHSSFSGFFLHE